MNWPAFLEKLHLICFMLKVKEVRRVFQEWKSAKTCTLNVFFVRPTVNEPFCMNKMACTFFVSEISYENAVKRLEFTCLVEND